MTDTSPLQPLRAFRASWPWIVGLVILGAVALGAASAIAPKKYTSSATVLFTGGSSDADGSAGTSGSDLARILATQSQVVLSDAVLSVAAEAGRTSVKSLRDRTEVTTSPDANVLTVSIEAKTPSAAQTQTAGVVSAYTGAAEKQGRQALERQVSAVQASIDRLSADLSQVQGNSDVDAARRSALLSQLQAASGRGEQLQTAATTYVGPASLLVSPSRPNEPSSRSTAVGAVEGAALGAALGMILAIAREAGVLPKRRPVPPGSSSSGNLGRRTQEIPEDGARPSPATAAPPAVLSDADRTS